MAHHELLIAVIDVLARSAGASVYCVFNASVMAVQKGKLEVSEQANRTEEETSEASEQVNRKICNIFISKTING